MLCTAMLGVKNISLQKNKDKEDKKKKSSEEEMLWFV